MTLEHIPLEKKIILFDGFCNLCDQSVQLIIKNDSKDVFRFVAIQSSLGAQIIEKIGINIQKTDSIILYEPGIAYYYKSEAALKIANEMGGFYKIISWLQILPSGLSNLIYDFVAKNRYRWYGKKDNCMMPTQEILNKFL